LLAALSSACAGRSAPPAVVSTPAAADEGIDVEELNGAPARRVEELLVGRFPGVRVFRLANGAISVQIRGASSVMGDNEPLYVLDGQPLADTPGGALMGIDPHDIARIEVLKDIGSISFYGVRGANGVVLITTKTGRKETRRLLPRDSYRYLHDVPSSGSRRRADHQRHLQTG
jgi:TonB-dependent SusC/RagA subfamily outer membrane receptor